MNKNSRLLQWGIELQSLAQAGLTYGKDVFDKERYERIREISAEILSELSDAPIEKVKSLFCNETGYQTPKIDTRAAIFHCGKSFLFVKAMENGLFREAGAMPIYQLEKTQSKK